MKKINLFCAVITLLAAAMSSCDNGQSADDVQISDFEDVTLNDGILNNTTFVSGGIQYLNSFDATYQYWEGFAASSRTDVTTATYENQYSPITGEAYKGTRFGVLYQGLSAATLRSLEHPSVQFESLYITNGTYPYLTMLNGNDYSKKFAEGDWFKLSITGLDADSIATGTVEVYLADFRDGKSEIINTWRMVDLSSIGACRSLSFSFDSTDKGEWGINTPTYAIIDNVSYSVVTDK